MEYILFVVFIILFLLIIFVQGIWSEKKERAWFVKKLENQYGQAPQKEYTPERFVRIPGYYEKHREESQIDDITWNDLGMDEIFKRINYTLSSTGEEYLYYRLRTPEFQEEKLKQFDEIAEYFNQNKEQRISFQLWMRKLGTTGKYSLYDYIEYLTKLGKQSNRKEYLMLLLLCASIGLMFFHLSLGILTLLVVVFYQMFHYFKIRKQIEPYITSLAYMIRLMEIAGKVRKLPIPVCEPQFQEIQRLTKNLNQSKKGSFWVFRDVRNSSGGNPLDIFLDYFNMLFHVDLIFFRRMVGEMINKVDKIDALVGVLGYLECAVSVSLYRASMNGNTCTPDFSKEELKIVNGYHPLIHNPVKNSIHAPKSVLLTGSNASGKSTFLKMTALNVLMAQTIYTVCADSYQAPFYRLFTSMSLRDNLEKGESYYIVEIKAIKRIMTQIKNSDIKMICFVDEVLRGTNTTERIAASSQILKILARDQVLCFAATHDMELTELLKKEYDNYHFEEEIAGNDILFNYQLRPGKAKTKNAIRLLQLMGYDEKMIESANQQAAVFEKTGIWKLT